MWDVPTILFNSLWIKASCVSLCSYAAAVSKQGLIYTVVGKGSKVIIAGTFSHFLKRDKTSFSSMSKSLRLTCLGYHQLSLQPHKAHSQQHGSVAWAGIVTCTQLLQGLWKHQHCRTLMGLPLEPQYSQEPKGAGAGLGLCLCSSNPKLFSRLCLDLWKQWML